MGSSLTDQKAPILPKQPLKFRTLHITKNFMDTKVAIPLLFTKYFGINCYFRSKF